MRYVLNTFSYTIDYLHDQVSDVNAEDMVRQPSGMINHPAWTIGHLAASCEAIGGEIGLAPWLPEHWTRSFGTGSRPLGLRESYPAREELMAVLGDAALRVTTRVQEMPPELLDRELPDERYRSILPTIAHAVTQILVAHSAHHIGQVAVWRRLVDLPPLERPFL
ncbi:MAG: DinB family protein [Phycisphaerales bacterium]